MLSGWLEAVLAVVFPPRCLACRTWVERHGMWCSKCAREIAAIKSIALSVHQLRYLDQCWAVAEYAGIVQNLIRNMKFSRDKRYTAHLGQLLDYALTSGHYAGVDAVVPVPLHQDRLTERGYNQTELIFKPWARRQGLIWLDALERIKSTVPQWELTLKERRKNIKGAFQVTHPGLVAGKNILLVDDICTSGVTMNECARALKKAGAKRVSGLALASGAR